MKGAHVLLAEDNDINALLAMRMVEAAGADVVRVQNGREAIAALLASVVPKPGEGPQRKHYITNILIELDGDAANVRSDYLVVRQADIGLLPVMGGTYRDRFVKQDGQWLFQRKELVHDIVGDMALKNNG